MYLRRSVWTSGYQNLFWPSALDVGGPPLLSLGPPPENPGPLSSAGSGRRPVYSWSARHPPAMVTCLATARLRGICHWQAFSPATYKTDRLSRELPPYRTSYGIPESPSPLWPAAFSAIGSYCVWWGNPPTKGHHTEPWVATRWHKVAGMENPALWYLAAACQGPWWHLLTTAQAGWSETQTTTDHSGSDHPWERSIPPPSVPRGAEQPLRRALRPSDPALWCDRRQDGCWFRPSGPPSDKTVPWP